MYKALLENKGETLQNLSILKTSIISVIGLLISTQLLFADDARDGYDFPQSNNIKAYYPLNGNTDDASANGNNGTIEGNVTLSDGSAYFDGTGGSRISIYDHNFTLGSESFTISLRAQGDVGTFGQNGNQYLFGTGTQSPHKSNRLHAKFENTNILKYGFWHNDKKFNIGSYGGSTDWHNIVFTYDRN